MEQLYNQTGARRRITACIAAMVSALCLCGSVRASQEAFTAAVKHVSAGQWDSALSALNAVSEPVEPRIAELKGLLLEHQALNLRREQQRQAVFEEKCRELDALDIEGLDESALLKAMDLFKSAWENASEPEQRGMLARSVFQSLRQAAYGRFTSDRQAGLWDAAWSKWLRWLTQYTPETYKQDADDLHQRRAMANALRKNPCDETAVPYSLVQHKTAAGIFQILEAHYVESFPFDRLTAHGLRRLSLLPEVLSNPTVSFSVSADPNGFAEWGDHIEWLQLADSPTSAEGIAAMLHTLTVVNATTLKLPDGVIIAQFTEAALAALDPYTEAVWPEGVGLFEKNLTGQFGGIGIRIRKDGEQLVIVSVIPDTPAAATSLSADDVIVAVDGQLAQEMTTDCAVSRISGPVGTAVSLTVRRAGSQEEQVVTVLRQKIVLPTVEGSQRADNDQSEGRWDYFLDAKDRIGYLQLNGFTDKTAEQARDVLDRLEQHHVAGLIIDVRGNGGGLLSEATAFADLFINDGVLLSSLSRGDKKTTWNAKSNTVNRDYPIVILIDEGSASASEIVAGVAAVRKPEQVALIGQRTYGKGTVQEVVDLGPAGGRLKLTTAYYYLPDGRPVKNRYKLQADGRTDWGIAPAIDIPVYAYEKTQVQQIRLERRRELMAKETSQNADAESESLVHRMLTTDAQLSTALVVLKAQILSAH